MMNGSNYSLSDIAAATGSNNRANDMWGGDGFPCRVVSTA